MYCSIHVPALLGCYCYSDIVEVDQVEWVWLETDKLALMESVFPFGLKEGEGPVINYT